MRGIFVVPGKQRVSAKSKNRLEDDFNIRDGIHLLEGREAGRFLEYFKRYNELTRRSLEQYVVRLFAVQGGGTLSFDVSKILYFEVNGHEITAHGTEKIDYIFNMTMKELANLVEGMGFLRVHKCYLISTGRVKKIRRGFLILENEIEIRVGRHYLENVRNHFQMKKMN